ncbi:ribonucleotide reductase system [Aeromonas enteropelogenes]|uniref:ribonucleoside-diphosphate reductase n=1 Tax=Aeromonas sp. 19NY04SH05-1 TaxID=2920537 RepID=A0AAU6TAR9_9GAMM|nr:NrdJb [Aeromonas enteropelogenes]MBL0522565.1 NrdJb [Aeromonas enteropelogenes]BEE16354.1 ribonucleotide reductase system [Aeromonas enteropelogenes]BEE20516.1 ribonucleotide reductase system [Aeromonas enteropelogenes]
MVKKIDKKIVAYKVHTRDEPQEDLASQDDVVHMHETVLRPERLMGTTYKLKTPEHVSEHSLFITINDIILNEGTVHETRRPFEIFINSKSLEHYQWIVALTRIISAVFRKGGDVTFLVEELRSVFDPKGGYWNKGKYVPSLIAEIGNVIETHLTEIGMLKAPGLDEHQQAFLAEKQAELQAEQNEEAQSAGNGFPANAALCYKCHTKALVLKDGCMTCLNCGDSKCG